MKSSFSILLHHLLALLASTVLVIFSRDAQAAPMGMRVLPPTSQHTEVTLFYPSSTPATAVQRGPFAMRFAVSGAMQTQSAKRALIVISHGSGGAPWPLVDLAQALVDAGYAVAMPKHRGDNYQDQSLVGPESWKLRPSEMSQAIDAIAQHAELSAQIDTQRVGVYGTSAGGLTTIVLAGGQWSPARFMRHCLENMAQDFHGCVGLATYLRGDALDSVKLAMARGAHRSRFDDETVYAHHDPRIVAAAASVPMATPFDLTSMARLRTPLGIIQARQDAWLPPRFHSQRLLAACTRCELIADLPQAGHGSLFSPWPAELAAQETHLLRDPAGFDRADVHRSYAKLVAFFRQYLSAPQ